jgi:hypothetical protein
MGIGGGAALAFGRRTTTGSTAMATTETDRPAAVQGEVRMLIDGKLVEAS